MVEIVNSLEDLCRLCAGKIDVMMGFHIFASDHRQIFKKICVCLPIQISAEDEFPKMVCVECACKLDIMFDFRERSILTAHLFSGMVSVSVNNADMMTVEQSIVIPNDGDSLHEYTEEFVTCENVVDVPVIAKADGKKYTDELSTALSENARDKVLLTATNTSTLDGKRYSSKPKTKIWVRHGLARKALGTVDGEKVSVASGDERLVSSQIALADQQKKLVFSCDSSVDIEVYTEPTNTDINVCLQSSDREAKGKEDGEGTLELLGVADKDAAGQLGWMEAECGCGQPEPGEQGPAGKETQAESHVQERRKARQRRAVKMKGDGGAEEEKGGEGRRGEGKRSEVKTCGDCGKQYQTNYKLQEHMRKHTGEKPYTCSYEDCKKAFRSKIGLAQHEANHSGQFEFSCQTCGKGFQCKSYLVVHQRVHSDLKPYTCKQCGRKFKTKQSLLDHMNRHLGVKPFLCDICGRGFITKGLCKSHQKVHSGTDNRQYPCHVCRKLFVSKSYLNTHFRIHTGEKPFMCEVCGKGFLTRVDLRIHSTMHTGEKSFVCETCGKAFARRDALRCHRRSHTGERPYRCEFCGQSFTQFSPMAIHKRLHTGERPYECADCGKSFVSRSTMLAHQRKHHPAHTAHTGSQVEVVEVQVEQGDQGGEGEESSQHLLAALNKTLPPGPGYSLVEVPVVPVVAMPKDLDNAIIE